MNLQSLIISWSVPTITVIITYIAQTIQASRISNKDMMDDQFKNFFQPYITQRYKEVILLDTWLDNPSTIPASIVLDQFSELMDNVSYLPESVSSKIPNYYIAMLDYLELADGNDDFVNADRIYLERYLEITIEILRTAEKLQRKLKLPNQSKYLLTMYAQNNRRN